MLPVLFKRCIHLIAELALTSTHSAASRRDAPASTSRSTRIRKSSEQGLGIDSLQKSNQCRSDSPIHNLRVSPNSTQPKHALAAANNATAAFVQHAANNPIAPGRGSLTGRTALERYDEFYIPDCLADPEYNYFDYQRSGQYRSMLGVPLLRDGAAIGVIVLMSPVVSYSPKSKLISSQHSPTKQ